MQQFCLQLLAQFIGWLGMARSICGTEGAGKVCMGCCDLALRAKGHHSNLLEYEHNRDDQNPLQEQIGHVT